MEHEIRRINLCSTGNVYGETAVVDDSTSETDIRRAIPNFFRQPHGRRETYTVYRGCLIVRMTVQFTGGPPTRRTVAYYYDVKAKDTFCLSTGHLELQSVYQAKKLIDRMFDLKCSWFGMAWDGSDRVPQVEPKATT